MRNLYFFRKIDQDPINKQVLHIEATLRWKRRDTIGHQKSHVFLATPIGQISVFRYHSTQIILDHLVQKQISVGYARKFLKLFLLQSDASLRTPHTTSLYLTQETSLNQYFWGHWYGDCRCRRRRCCCRCCCRRRCCLQPRPEMTFRRKFPALPTFFSATKTMNNFSSKDAQEKTFLQTRQKMN